MCATFRVLAAALVAGLLMSVSALADDALNAAINNQLKAQGYTQIDMSRTWLGRVRFVAQSPSLSREIILNPRTNEILRDVTRQLDGPEGQHPVPQLLDRPAAEQPERSGDRADGGVTDGPDRGPDHGPGPGAEGGGAGGGPSR